MNQYHFLKKAFVLFFPFLIWGCNHQDESNNVKHKVPQMEYKVGATLYMQHASEYRALCFQAFNLAALRLDEMFASGKFAKPAIVIDIDETVLDNSPESGYEILNDLAFTFELWKSWTDLATADTIPGAVKFLKYAADKGVEIFYVSNRREVELGPTIRNLLKYNIPQADSNHVFLKKESSGKASRRQKITDMGYEIVLLIGDNLNDVAEIFESQTTKSRNRITDSLQNRFGQNWIVLPNPNYGAWEKALYNNSYKWTPAQLDSIRKRKLESFK
jgi:5'-nucleotidase (lipoprotein e(P4) family)